MVINLKEYVLQIKIRRLLNASGLIIAATISFMRDGTNND